MIEIHDKGDTMAQVRQAVAARMTSRWGARVAVVLFVALAGGLLSATVTPTSSDPTAPSLPAEVESVRADSLAARLPSAGVNPAIIVVTRGGAALTPADLAAVATVGAELTSRYGAPPVAGAGGAEDGSSAGAAAGASPVIPSRDDEAALLTVSLPASLAGEDLVSTVTAMRAVIESGLPDGLTAELTGGPGLATDISSVFEGADVRLLAVTASIVALLLLVTYRSPLLWVVPLFVVGTADQLGAQLTKVVSAASGWEINESTSGIASVLVFGAGTNYALLLIARYREELRRHADHRDAMREAMRSAAEPIVGSALTVTASLCTLALALDGGTRAIGWTSALGVLVVLAGVVLVLPAALVLSGRRLFWPFIPWMGDPDPTEAGLWARIAGAVTRRPHLVGITATVVLLVMASGLIGARVGLSQTEQFRIEAESVRADALAARLPSAEVNPAIVIVTRGGAALTPADLAAVASVGAGLTGRYGAPLAAGAPVIPSSDGRAALLTVALPAALSGDELVSTVKELRAALGSALPDGLTAELTGGPGLATDTSSV
ncbi:MAG TPA: MMPL family transporter, partial [Candidatus Lustribacter sp.]|nr:MMPL family transporter [Candidatus Lustribacter sp.]